MSLKIKINPCWNAALLQHLGPRWDLVEGVNLAQSWLRMDAVAFWLTSVSFSGNHSGGGEQMNAKSVFSQTTSVTITSWRRHAGGVTCWKATRNASVLQPRTCYSQLCMTKHPRGPYCRKSQPRSVPWVRPALLLVLRAAYSSSLSAQFLWTTTFPVREYPSWPGPPCTPQGRTEAGCLPLTCWRPTSGLYSAPFPLSKRY